MPSNEKYLNYLFAKHVVNNIQIKNNYQFGSKYINFKSEARKTESGSMENVKEEFLQSVFLLSNHKGFLKNVEVRMIDKTKDSDPTKQEF